MPYDAAASNAEGAPAPCEGKGATAKRDTPNDDKPGLVAEKPERCLSCYRLIKPGQTYHLTIEVEVLCEGCALSEGVIWGRDDPAFEVKPSCICLLGRHWMASARCGVSILPFQPERVAPARPALRTWKGPRIVHVSFRPGPHCSLYLSSQHQRQILEALARLDRLHRQITL